MRWLLQPINEVITLRISQKGVLTCEIIVKFIQTLDINITSVPIYWIETHLLIKHIIKPI